MVQSIVAAMTACDDVALAGAVKALVVAASPNDMPELHAKVSVACAPCLIDFLKIAINLLCAVHDVGSRNARHSSRDARRHNARCKSGSVSSFVHSSCPFTFETTPSATEARHCDAGQRHRPPSVGSKRTRQCALTKKIYSSAHVESYDSILKISTIVFNE